MQKSVRRMAKPLELIYGRKGVCRPEAQGAADLIRRRASCNLHGLHGSALKSAEYFFQKKNQLQKSINRRRAVLRNIGRKF